MLHKRPQRRSRFTALPWGMMASRGLFALLVTLALTLMILSRANPGFVADFRARLVDFFAPVLAVVSQPIQAVQSVREKITSYVNLAAEVDRLRSENARLKSEEQRAFALSYENDSLRQLLNVQEEKSTHEVTARVIASVGAPYARSLIIAAGTHDGVIKNMAVLGPEGLIGRVAEAGMWSARVLLLTDPTSRVPVMTPDGSVQAILAGDNSTYPEVRHASQDADLRPGTQLVTSGQGGIFPPHLPVGAVSANNGETVRLLPYAKGGNVQFVRLTDFGLLTTPVNPFVVK